MSAVTCTIDSRGIATVTLNRAEKHNAFDDSVIAELTTVFADIDDNERVRAVVLAANGKSFSAGADLNWMKRMASYTREENFEDAKGLANMLATLNEMSKPTIARVQGAAYGGGVGLVACCDIAIATSRASFCLSEVKLGLLPSTISPYVIEAIGPKAARRYFTTAERFSADRALQLGLISECVSEELLDKAIETLLAALLANSPKAMTAAKLLIADVKNQAIDQELKDMTSQSIADIRSSEEGREGVSAFLAKRSPRWVAQQEEEVL